MNSCKRFDETSLPFYSKLNEKGISNIGHAHSQNVWEVFEIKKTLVSIMIYMFKAILYCLLMYLKTLETSV